MRFIDVWIDRHGTGAKETETSPSEVGHLDTLERYNRLRRNIECRCRVTPNCQSDGEVGIVDERELTLVVWLAGGFRDDLGGLSDFFKDADRVDGGIFLNRLQVANAGKVESNLRDSVLLLRLCSMSETLTLLDAITSELTFSTSVSLSKVSS